MKKTIAVFVLAGLVSAARAETIDLVCSQVTSAETKSVRLLIDTDRRTVTEIWSQTGKTYEYQLTEVSGQFIKYADLSAEWTRDVAIDRVVGTIHVKFTERSGRVENVSYPCRRATQKF